ncbi:MAG TPA: peptide ABC transporter substrate-binding protein [Candidatus Didemnitutus sp.]
MTFLPAAALAWEADPSGLKWTFHLDPGAHWCNGDPVTARDFVATIRRALDPALAAPKAGLFLDLRNAAAFYHGTIHDPSQIGAIARDQFTLELALAHPTPHLLALAASGPWIPIHWTTVEKFGDTRESAWTRPGNYVGNGPFVLAEWKPHELIRVTRNPHYHAATHVLVDEIDFLKFDDENTEERAYRAGQVDVTMTIPVTKRAGYHEPERHVQPLAETRYLAVNVTRAPLSDVRVRRALSLGIDRQQLVDAVLQGGQSPADTFLPPGLAGVEAVPDPDLAGEPAARRARDLAEARHLLADAGFPEGRGLRKLEISTWVDNPVIEAIQQMWRRDLGVETAISVREARVHAAALRSGDFDLGFAPAIPDYNDASALLSELERGASGNYPHWGNARFGGIVAEAAATADPRARADQFREAGQILRAEQPVIPLYFNTQIYLVSPRVSGWKSDRLWTRTYLDVSLSP